MCKLDSRVAGLVTGLIEIAERDTPTAIAAVLGVDLYDVGQLDPRAVLVSLLGLAWYEARPQPRICIACALEGEMREEAIAHELGHAVIDVCCIDVPEGQAEVWCDAFASALLRQSTSLLAARDSGRTTVAHVAGIEHAEVEKLAPLL